MVASRSCKSFHGRHGSRQNATFTAANSTFQSMVGYTEDELKKLTPLDITPAGDREANRVVLKELQRGKRQHTS